MSVAEAMTVGAVLAEVLDLVTILVFTLVITAIAAKGRK